MHALLVVEERDAHMHALATAMRNTGITAQEASVNMQALASAWADAQTHTHKETGLCGIHTDTALYHAVGTHTIAQGAGGALDTQAEGEPQATATQAERDSTATHIHTEDYTTTHTQRGSATTTHTDTLIDSVLSSSRDSYYTIV
jgi:hypothetical protein